VTADAPRIGLVLGAGGTVGHAFHVGVLAALDDAGWDARGAAIVAGTSTGAVTAALLRAGMSPADLYARVTGDPLSVEGRRILADGGGWPTFAADMTNRSGRPGGPSSLRLFGELARRPWRTRPGILLAGISTLGQVSPMPIAEGFNRLFGHRWPADPLWVCATDLDTAERVVFGRPGAPSTDVGTAVAASSAVPTFFAPVDVAGRRFVDGGAHSPVNADVVAEAHLPPDAHRPPDAHLPLDAVVVSAPMAIGGWPGRAGVDLPGRLLNHLLTLQELRRLRREGVPVLVFEPGARELELMHYDAFDPQHRVEIARRARHSAGDRAVTLIGLTGR
jgi:NTE family protein